MFSVISGHSFRVFLLLWRGAVGVFYSPIRLDKEVVEWGLTFTHGIVHHTTRGLSGAVVSCRFKTKRTYLCVLLVCRGRTEERFDFGGRFFYKLLWSRHLAAIRSTVWKAKDVIPINTIQPFLVKVDLEVMAMKWYFTLRKWSLAIRCSLMSSPGYNRLFWGGYSSASGGGTVNAFLTLLTKWLRFELCSEMLGNRENLEQLLFT